MGEKVLLKLEIYRHRSALIHLWSITQRDWFMPSEVYILNLPEGTVTFFFTDIQYSLLRLTNTWDVFELDYAFGMCEDLAIN